MRTTTFGNYNSFSDLSLYQTKREIGNPKLKGYKVEVEGAHGSLDYSEYFGEPKFENRTLKFEYSTIVPKSQFLALYSTIQNALQGQRVHITLSDDTSFYYDGRLELSSFTDSKGIGSITITADCDPFKYKQSVTTVTRTISGATAITLANLRKKVVPTITTTASMTFAFGGNTVNHSAGTFVIPELELSAGNNTVTVTGTGNVTFTYQEGGL